MDLYHGDGYPMSILVFSLTGMLPQLLTRQILQDTRVLFLMCLP